VASATLDPSTLIEPRRTSPYSLGEEIANSLTHGLGTALSIAGLTLLVAMASIFGDGFHVASAIVYGISLVLLYTASTLYHAIPFPRARHALKILDHSSIYVLIAGTYTPFTLVTLREAGGWWLFGIIWGLAVLGIALEAAWVYRPKWLSAAVYVAMGWLVIFRIGDLSANLPPAGIALLVAGGVTYTLGTAFYVLKRVRYTHAVWHVFVLGGSICHFLAVHLYVLPPAG
jgi:hemolysin III